MSSDEETDHLEKVTKGRQSGAISFISDFKMMGVKSPQSKPAQAGVGSWSCPPWPITSRDFRLDRFNYTRSIAESSRFNSCCNSRRFLGMELGPPKRPAFASDFLARLVSRSLLFISHRCAFRALAAPTPQTNRATISEPSPNPRLPRDFPLLIHENLVGRRAIEWFVMCVSMNREAG